MLRKFLFAVLFLGVVTYAVADDTVCPAGFEPTKYAQLEYIESTVSPSEAYINTELNYDSAYTYKVTYAKGGSQNAIIGARPTSKRYHMSVTYIDDDSCVYLDSAVNNIYARINDHNFGEKHTIVINQSNMVLTDNGNDIWKSSFYTTTDNPYPMYLFGVNIASLGQSGGARTGYLKIYEYFVNDSNGRLLQNFIPAKRNSDSVIGMVDTVSGTFFTNQGTGEFVAGPVVQTEFMNLNDCSPCPPNTYKDFVGNSECTPCPDALISPSGSTSLNQCGRILHIGDYNAYMPVGRRTEHGLCTMMDGVKYCADLYEKE